MKIVIISNDFRVYWKGRLQFLRPFLAKHQISMQAVELFGKGSPYAFDSYSNNEGWWECLFPNKAADELTKQDIAWQLLKKLDEINPDIVIASPVTFFAGALGLRWAKQAGKKFIMFDDAKPLKQFKRNFLVRWVRDTITRQVDALWLPAKDYDVEYPALKGLGIEFFYGFNCIDNVFFKPVTAKKFEQHTIICVARLVNIKNINGLLNAWQKVEHANANYKLQIIGDGPDKDMLTQLAGDLSLERVSFLGSVNYVQLPEFLHQADAFILPSLSETWGLVVNEAMAAGLPVLLSDRINAAQSLLNEGINGYGFDPFVTNEIASAILKFIELPAANKQQMSATAIKTIGQMDYENMGLRLLEALPIINSKKFKKPGIIAGAIINRWYGKHDTVAWDKLN